MNELGSIIWQVCGLSARLCLNQRGIQGVRLFYIMNGFGRDRAAALVCIYLCTSYFLVIFISFFFILFGVYSNSGAFIPDTPKWGGRKIIRFVCRLEKMARISWWFQNYSKRKNHNFVLTLLLEAKVEPSQRFEALELEGVVDHGGQLGVEQVLAFVVAEPGVDHLIAEDVKDFLVTQSFLVRLQTGTEKWMGSVWDLFDIFVARTAAVKSETFLGGKTRKVAFSLEAFFSGKIRETQHTHVQVE